MRKPAQFDNRLKKTSLKQNCRNPSLVTAQTGVDGRWGSIKYLGADVKETSLV